MTKMTNMIKKLTVLCGAGALMLGASAARADKLNVVVNGGFETGDFTGWTLDGNAAYSQVSGIEWGYLHAASGSDYAMLGSFGQLSTLSQDLSTLPGGDYALSFELASDGLPGNEFSVDIDGASVFDQTEIGAMDYTKYTFDFTATGRSTDLSFGSRDDQGYLLLDDVCVIGPPALSIEPDGAPLQFIAPVPLPAGVWIGGLPMLALAAASVRRKLAVQGL